jgi:hypothetical protein
MQTPRHPTSDEMDALVHEARVTRSAVLFDLCARLWSRMSGRRVAPAPTRFA